MQKNWFYFIIIAMQAKIFIVHHKKYHVRLNNGLFEPIHVGKALSNDNLDMIWDDTWDNISSLNRRFCEITAMYRARKNRQDLDYIWFCHYRRHFRFRMAHNRLYSHRWIFDKKFIIDFMQYMWLIHNDITFDEIDIEQEIRDYDIILPKKTFIFKPIYKWYVYSHGNHDIDICLRKIEEIFPEYKENIKRVFFRKSHRIFTTWYTWHLFIMKKEQFNAYMERLFEILFSIKDQVWLSDDPYKQRSLWILWEMIFNIYIDKLKREKSIRIKEIKTLFIT